MTVRKIVKIDEGKCNGCGLCIPNCAEGALQIIDGKAKLISDRFCDGLGACLGHCPQGAITVAEREAKEFDEKILCLHRKKSQQPVFGGCPSSQAVELKRENPGTESGPVTPSQSMLCHWPVQLKLVPVTASYFADSDLLVVADCVPFAYPDFHRDFLKGKSVVVGCPKLDDIGFYIEKLTEIFRRNSIRSVTVPYMEVPCCFGLVRAVGKALKASGKDIPLKKVKVGVRGWRRDE